MSQLVHEMKKQDHNSQKWPGEEEGGTSTTKVTGRGMYAHMVQGYIDNMQTSFQSDGLHMELGGRQQQEECWPKFLTVTDAVMTKLKKSLLLLFISSSLTLVFNRT